MCIHHVARSRYPLKNILMSWTTFLTMALATERYLAVCRSPTVYTLYNIYHRFTCLCPLLLLHVELSSVQCWDMTNDGVLLYGIKITACSRAVDWSLLQWSCGRTEWGHNNCTSASKKHRITLSLINALHILYCNDTVDKIRQAAAVPLAGGDLQLPGAGPHLPPPDLPRLPPPQPAQVPGGAARVHSRHRHRQLHQAHSQLQRHRTQVQTLASLIR